MAILLLAVFFQLGCKCQCYCCCQEWRGKSGIGQDWSVEFTSVWVLCFCHAWRTSIAVVLSVQELSVVRNYVGGCLLGMRCNSLPEVYHNLAFFGIDLLLWILTLLFIITINSNQLLFLTWFFHSCGNETVELSFLSCELSKGVYTLSQTINLSRWGLI